MENELYTHPDTRPVVAMIVFCAFLTCCCLLLVAAGYFLHWRNTHDGLPTLAPSSFLSLPVRPPAWGPVPPRDLSRGPWQ